VSGRDLEADGFPHGTVDGWEAGCKGRWCLSEGQSCLEARLRFVREWGYRKEVLAERAARAAEAKRRKRRRTFAAADDERIRQLALAGRNNVEISNVIGFTPHGVGKRRRDLGLPVIGRGRPRKREATS
jgi:hypothetical protein